MWTVKSLHTKQQWHNHKITTDAWVKTTVHPLLFLALKPPLILSNTHFLLVCLSTHHSSYVICNQHFLIDDYEIMTGTHYTHCPIWMAIGQIIYVTLGLSVALQSDTSFFSTSALIKLSCDWLLLTNIKFEQQVGGAYVFTARAVWLRWPAKFKALNLKPLIHLSTNSCHITC